MTSLTIRRLDPIVKERLRVRAALHGHSMEEEVRRILERAVGNGEEEPRSAYNAIRRHFEGLGGVDLERPIRRPGRPPPTFD